MRHGFRLLGLIALGSAVLFFNGASAHSADMPVSELEPVLVSGVHPGPGLWKVTSNDHELWILGTLSPLPRRMEWQSGEVEQVIARAQAVLSPPRWAMGTKSGVFGNLALLPSLVGVRNNPDGARLRDVLPEDVYARWSVLKQRYLGNNLKVEKWRPVFAALELYEAAIEKARLSQTDIVGKAVGKATKRAGLEPITPTFTFELDDARAAIKEFKRGTLDDLDCLRKTLDRIDSDLGAMTARANAWASADLDALRALPYTDQMTVCRDALADSQLAHDRGVRDIRAQAFQVWLDAAQAALAEHEVTFARLPIAELLAADGIVARLQALGYTVQAPDLTGDSDHESDPDNELDAKLEDSGTP